MLNQETLQIRLKLKSLNYFKVTSFFDKAKGIYRYFTNFVRFD